MKDLSNRITDDIKTYKNGVLIMAVGCNHFIYAVKDFPLIVKLFVNINENANYI